MDLLASAVPSSADGTRGDHTKHVKVRDEHGDTSRCQRGFPDMEASLVVDVVDFTRLDPLRARTFREQHCGEHQFLLGRERADDRCDLIRFNLRLRAAHVVHANHGRAFHLGTFRGHTKQVQCTTGIAVFLCSQGCTEFNHALVKSVIPQRGACTFDKDVPQVVRNVRVEDDVLLTEAGTNARVEEQRALFNELLRLVKL